MRRLREWSSLAGGSGLRVRKAKESRPFAALRSGLTPELAAAAVLGYHAIAFWVPSVGGLFAYWRLRRRLYGSGLVPAGPGANGAPVGDSSEAVGRPELQT